MHSKPSSSNLNDVRYQICKSRFDLRPDKKSLVVATQSVVDLSLIPPCKSSVRKHCQRVNYQTFMWKTAHFAEQQLPSPGKFVCETAA